MEPSTLGTLWRQRARSRNRPSPPWCPPRQAFIKSIRVPTATRRSCPTAQCLLSEPVPLVYKSPTKFGSPADRSTSLWDRMTARRAVTADRDFVWWLGVLGKWEASAPPHGAEHVTIAVSGANGGHTVDFRGLAEGGITLLGRAGAMKTASCISPPTCVTTSSEAMQTTSRCCKKRMPSSNSTDLDLPEEPNAHLLGPYPKCVTEPILELDLAAAGITSVVWATGFGVDYSWLQVDALDERGRPKHQRGVSTEAGVYFLGPALAVAQRLELHLGRVARREVPRGPD